MVQAPHPETGVEPSFALSEAAGFVSAAGADKVAVPDTDFMLGAEYKRSGPDLVLLGDDGRRLLIPDYFKHERLPDLVGPDGARLDGDLVDTLAGPLAPGQYAQATSAPPERIAIGRVDKASGIVQITRANGVTEVSLAPGAVIYKGDVIQTGRGATVSISFGDGTAFNIAPFTRMVMNEFAYDPNVTTNSGVMTLVRGSFAFIAGQVAKTGGLEIHTPVATMGIRGTTGAAVQVPDRNLGAIKIGDGNYKFFAAKDIDGRDSEYSIRYIDAGGVANRAIVTVGTITGVNLNDPGQPLTFTPATGPDLSPADHGARDFFNSLFNSLIANYPNVLQDLPPLPFNQGQRTDVQPDPGHNAQTTTAAAAGGAASGGSSGIVTATAETNGQAASGQPTTPTQTVLDVPARGSGSFLTVPLALLTDIPTTAPTNPTAQLTNNPTLLPGITALPGDPIIVAGLPSVTLVAAGGDVTGTDTSLVQLTVGSSVAAYDTTGWTANPDGTFSQSGTFGTATLDPAQNSLTYHLDNTSAQTKALADQQSVSDPFTVTVKGSNGGTIASAPVLFSIVGTNDAPTVGAATLTGAVFENATPPAETTNETASGTIAFGDVDLTDVHVVSAVFKETDDESGQPLGSLVAARTSDTTGGGADGLITWTFTASDAALDRLAAGQVVHETHTISLSDQHAGVVTRDVSITITGTNDAPAITAGATTGSVKEDSAGQNQASGQLTASDPDQGATQTWFVVGGSSNAHADYHFRVDSFSITKATAVLLQDDFSDGNPPPNSPPFNPNSPTPTPTSYSTRGTFTETGGKLFLDSGAAALLDGVGTSDPIIGQVAVARTNIDPNSSLGLKQGQPFTVSGVFDLVLPDSSREAYGIRISDHLVGGPGNPPDQLGDDTIELVVRQNLLGQDVVALRRIDFAANSVTNLESFALNPPSGADQIVLKLNHNANDAFVTAAFQFRSNGADVGALQTFTLSASIFHSDPGSPTPENWTLAELVAYAPQEADSLLSGVYGALNVGQSGSWTYVLDNSRPATQALAEGQHASETFTVEVRDQFDAFDSRDITIDVAGRNDAPTVSAAVSGGGAEGSGTAAVNLLDFAADVDAGAALHIENLVWDEAPGNLPAGFTAVGNTLAIDTNAAAYNQLAEGETFTTHFSYDVVDEHGGSAAQTATITVTGTNDAPAVTAGTVAGGMIEAVAIAGLGVPFTTLAASYLSHGNSLVNGLGGTNGFGEYVVDVGDDNSTGAIDLTAVFGAQGLNFFGTSYTSLYINNNGNLSFGEPVSTYTPETITGASPSIIAPFWADVDTRGSGATPAGTTGASDGANRVFYDFDPVNHVLTVTWDDVGYFGSHTDKADAFQLQLIGLTNGDFDIVFRYEDINWTTGDASGGTNGLGGTPARAGFSDGLGHFFELPQSGTADMLNLPTILGNTGIAGVEVFLSHGGEVVPTLLSTNGVINFSDPDLTDVHTASATFLGPSQALGNFSLVQTSDTTGTGTGGQFAWTYTVDPHDIAYLGAGQSTTETFQVDISDGHGEDTIQDVTVTLVGVNDAPVAVNDWVVTNFGAAAFDIPEWALLANDTDPENGAIDVAAGSVSSTNASELTVGHTTGSGSDGNVAVTDLGALDGTFQYTPTDGLLAGAAATVTIDNNSTETMALTTTMNGRADAPTILIGGNNADTLTGGQFNDTLLGNGGDNVLIGGAGNDTFIFTPSATPHTDTIADFTPGVDVIDVSAANGGQGFSDFAALQADADFTGDTITFQGNEGAITLTGVQVAQLHENNFILHH